MLASCKDCSNDFEIKESNLNFYKQLEVPIPKKCPTCRFIERLTIRNARSLYYRKCDFSGKQIISSYHDKHQFPVYGLEAWFSDSWDALTYGSALDFNQPFFKQFKDLKWKVPHFSVFIVQNTLENSDYTNCTGYLKNCYLLSESDYNEDCYYSNRIYHSKNIVDSSNCYESELCYECINCASSYNLKYSEQSENCQDSFFLKNCIGCKNCIGSINLRHQEYVIFNQRYPKEIYEKMKTEFCLDNSEGVKNLRAKTEQFFKDFPKKAIEGENNFNVTGDYIYNSKNCFECFDCKDLEDCEYCAKVASSVRNSQDFTSWGFKSELMYQCAACGDSAYNLKFCTTCSTNNSFLEYCDQCVSCSYCFGCVGLKKKKYCILNQQYTEAEYFVLREKLIAHMTETGEWGEFFPKDINPYAYNETIAMDYFPFDKTEALKRGFKWKDADLKDFLKQSYVIPNSTAGLTNDVLKEILACEQCGRNYKIITQELDYYKDNNLPLPHFCATCRHMNRLLRRNKPVLRDTKCASCNKDIFTANPPGTTNIYCNDCYKEKVY